MNLQENIQRIKEVMGIKSDLNEISDESYELIKEKYSESRIIMTKDDFIEFKPTPIEKQEQRYKPKGLWYGIGTSWLDWVRMEMPEWETEHIFKIDIDKTQMCIIRNIDDIYSFTRQFSVGDNYFKMIDWKKVANLYSGIEIAPYIYEARMDLSWYYPWDVASGCIWDEGVIKNIEKIV